MPKVRAIADHHNRYGDSWYKSADAKAEYDAPEKVAKKLIELGLAEAVADEKAAKPAK